MRLNTARQCWFDAHYTPRDSQGSFIERLGLMGTMVQMTDRDSSTPAAMHQALAGRIQSAIKTLPRHVQSFGHHMYSPIHDDDDDLREAVEAYVFMLAYQAFTKETRMTAKKAEKARYVAAGVLYRYRRMHQGGASACSDPLEKAEHFRDWLDLEKGCRLAKDNFAREWEPFVQSCFDVCNDLDKTALSAVGRCLGEMREAA